MVSAAQSTGASNLPGALQRLVKDLTEPKKDWTEILQQQIMSTMKSDHTWMRPSRKSWHTSAILPGQNNDEMIDICLSLDASGSMESFNISVLEIPQSVGFQAEEKPLPV